MSDKKTKSRQTLSSNTGQKADTLMCDSKELKKATNSQQPQKASSSETTRSSLPPASTQDD